MNIIKLPKKIAAAGPAVLAEWLQAENQTIKKGQALARIETADAVIELQAETAGTVLKRLIPAGCAIPANGRIAVIGKPGDDVGTALAKPAEHAGSVTAAAAASAPPLAQAPVSTPKRAPAPAAPAPAAPTGSVIPILMPQAGQSMEEGAILRWEVKVGDIIEVGQPIVEIETDKLLDLLHRTRKS